MPNGKPNILVIWGDDIGMWNLSCYSDGLMGYRTPNIDRIANEGMRFTDSYGEQSCTAGRASFLTGQCGLPHRPQQGRPARRADRAPSARIRRSRSCSSRSAMRPVSSARTTSAISNQFLPTVHGFDEFFGNLYHLNAEEEPEDPDYPSSKSSRLPEELRSARRPPVHGRPTRTTTPSSRAGARSASSGSRTPDRSPGSGWRPATTTSPTPPIDFIERQHKDGAAVLRAGQLHPHAPANAHEAGEPRPGRAMAVAVPRHDDRPRQERRAGPRCPGPARHRRRHDRHVRDRQRAAHELLARRRDDPVPQREEHELGGRLPSACAGPLAG